MKKFLTFIFPKSIIRIILLLIVCLLFGVPVAPCEKYFSHNTFSTLFIFLYATPFCVIAYFAYKFNHLKLFEKKLLKPRLTVLPVLLVVGFQSFAVFVMPLIENFFTLDPSHSNPDLTIIYLLNAVILGPILEEWIFRGTILRAMLTANSPRKSVIITSVIFALIHVNPVQIPGAFILSVYFCYVFYKTQSISTTIILHSIANLTVIVWNYYIL